MESCYTAFAMDVKTYHTLELPHVLERLARFAAFSGSKELAAGLKPTTDLSEAIQRQRGTTEARTLLSMKSDLSIGGARDVRPQAEAAARGAVLEPMEFLDIKFTMIAARTLRRQFEKLDHPFATLMEFVQGLQPIPDLIDSISTVMDDRGEILDGASEKLASIRRDLRVAHDRLTGKLQRMLSDPQITPMLQEAIITQRDGRYVIPLQADFKGKIEAVIHDQSASGATLFIEPLQVVELNNQVRELQLAERDEIRRILNELSLRVGGHVQEIQQTVSALAQLDLAFAKARYADSLHASEPILKEIKDRDSSPHPGSTLRLLDARHPLLDPETVVPIDLVLDDDTYALVITGPNTGGKTVSLKTAGLLVLMAQCGLHIPVTSGSELSVFDVVYADIGDEQSIEQSLSTFSAHIANIIRILDRATSRSLVLLDELGAGTDPQEGSALARAILDTLLERSITTLVATHYPELKTYAHATPGVLNASVEFDLGNLQPTYHLTIGLPGRSNALAIASRLGLDEGVVERARTWVSPEELRAESLLDEIHRQRELARQERTAAEANRQQAQSLQIELSQRLDEIETERRSILRAAREQAEEQLDTLGDDLRTVRRQLNAARQPLEALKQVEAEVDRIASQIAADKGADEPAGEAPHRPLKVGDTVDLKSIRAKGVITALDEEHAEVQVGRLRVRARMDELALPGENSNDSMPPMRSLTEPQRRSTEPVGLVSPPLELDLRGQSVEEALEQLERHLDSAYMAAAPFVRVIHGKGTGRLRKAVREALKNNPYVASFEAGQASEGGDGVTFIRMASH